MSLITTVMELLFKRQLPQFSHSFRLICSTNSVGKWKITETIDKDTTFVGVTEVKEEARADDELCSLCTCNIPMKLSYSDVLVLEQFMREDGSVLPRQITGLCKKQQLRLERCVMQAHWAGLFPDKTIPDFDRAGYKRFNRYWNDDMDMYRLKIKKVQGTWFYIKRYPTKNNAIKS